MSESPGSPLLSVVLPAHNEEAVIGSSLRRLYSYLAERHIDHELILIADGCTDRTVELAESESIPTLRIEEQWPNGGKGSALRRGIMHSRGDLVALMDADLDIHPRSLGGLFDQLVSEGSCDAVVGSKVHRRSIVDYPKSRRVLSRVFRALTRALFQLPVSDTQTGLKIFKRKPLREALPFAESDGFAFDLELLVALNDHGYRIEEGPIELEYRFDSRVGIRSGFSVLAVTFRLYLARKRRSQK